MITVLGSAGFIGSHLTRYLDEVAMPYVAPRRGEPLAGRELGHVIDCAGITADFRVRPYDTIDAHISRVVDIIRNCSFDSFVYLSSTRLYKDHPSSPAHEDDDFRVNPAGMGGLYNLSKATGESIVLTLGGRGRVVRLSNVYGDRSESHNFLPSIILDALDKGEIVLRTSRASAKDYVNVRDVVRLLPRIAIEGRETIYNVASGRSVSNGDIVDAIAELTGCGVTIAADAETWSYPELSIARARREFGFEPSDLLADLPALVDSYRQVHS